MSSSQRFLRRPSPAPRRWRSRCLLGAVLLVTTVFGASADAGETEDVRYAADTEIGIYERLGETIPLDLEFTDSEDHEVRLGDLIRRPTILTLVYYRCPTICSPLLRELGDMVDRLDLVPGIDYDLITVSFDIEETTELARNIKAALLEGMERKVPPEAWTFLLGDAENVERLTEAVGFKFRKDDTRSEEEKVAAGKGGGDDFIHAGTILFVGKDGKIVRYLNGKNLLPADLKLAIFDAVSGTPRSIFQRLQRLCYAYDPAGKTYVLQINRIILFVTLSILALFLAFLLIRRRPSRKDAAASDAPPAERSSR